MIDEFKPLNEEEIETMLKVPALVAILIAGADNDIDRSELKEAVSLTRLKRQKARAELIRYYEVAGEEFEPKLKEMIQSYPAKATERNPMIIAELEKLNTILPKLDNKFAVEFYASIKDMAKKVAEASGGVLGYMAVGYEESKLIGLSMVQNPSA